MRTALSSAAMVAALALLSAGCGGGSPEVASVASTTTATAPQTGAVAFAACMRTHGIPGWPDPTTGGVFDKSQLAQLGVSPNRMRAIEDGPCKGLLTPTAGSQANAAQAQARLAGLLSFARCMRSHGVARFPDPSAQSGLTVEMVRAQGIDVHAPAVLHVVQACLPASHGVLTPAKISEALANAG